MADLKLKYGESANTPIQDNGSLLFTTDKKEIYLDQDEQRYLIKGPNTVQKTLTNPNNPINLAYESVQRINLEFDLTIEDPGENSLCLTITGISQGAGENGEDIENNYSIQFGEPVYTNRFIGEISIADRGFNNQLNISYNINKRRPGILWPSCGSLRTLVGGQGVSLGQDPVACRFSVVPGEALCEV